MNINLKNIQLTALGACLTVALTAWVVSTTANADANEVRGVQATKLSLKQAINIASKQASGTLVSAEFDDNVQVGVYEIEFSTDSTNYEIKVDATTGAIIDTNNESLDSNDVNEYNAQQKAKVHIIDAISIAEKNTKGQITEIEFKNDRDYAEPTSYYEVEVLKGNSIIELNIDADTGSVFAKKTKS